MPELVAKLRSLRWRLGLLFGLDALGLCLYAAAFVGCVWVLFFRLFPILDIGPAVFLGLAACAVLAALIQTLRRWPSLSDSALAADERMNLRERFTSSLALADAESPMADALHRDALSHSDALHIRRDFPLRRPRHSRSLVVALLVLGSAYLFLPEMDLFNFRERQAEAKATTARAEARAKQLRVAALTLKPPEQFPSAELEGHAKALEALADQLERQEITEKQALAKVANLAKTLDLKRKSLEKQQGDGKKQSSERQPAMMQQGLAADIKNNRAAEASEKLKAMKKKLEKGELSEEEKKKLAEELKKLSEALKKEDAELNAALSEALAAAAAGLESMNMAKALEGMESLELSLEEMKSAMEQLAMLDQAMLNIGDWKKMAMGESKFCRSCGRKMGKPCKDGKCGTCGKCSGGKCGSCAGANPGFGYGLGLGGGGRGTGNRVGELGEEDVDFKPTKLPGEMTQGKLLASILQKGAPDLGAEATVEMVSSGLVAVKQEAEQALTQEEIPRGSKEFVRQYFGTLDPESVQE
jgi:hypothetical protein